MNDLSSNGQKALRKGPRLEILRLLKELECFDYAEEDLQHEYIRLYCKICRSDVVIDRILRIRKHIDTNKHQKNAIKRGKQLSHEGSCAKRPRFESNDLDVNIKQEEESLIETSTTTNTSQDNIENINSRLINENLYLRGSLELEKKKNEYLNMRLNEFSESFKLFHVYFNQFSSQINTKFDLDTRSSEESTQKMDNSMGDAFGLKFQLIEKDLEVLRENLTHRHDEVRQELNEVLSKKDILQSKLDKIMRVL